MIGKKGTLTRQLVTRTALLVALVAVAFSALMTFVAVHVLQDQLDRQLDAAMALVLQGGRGTAQRPGAGPGIPPGTIILLQAAAGSGSGVPVYAWRTDRGGWSGLDDASTQILFNQNDSGRRNDKQTVALPDGDYRVAVNTRNDLKVVVALPLSDMRGAAARMVLAEVIIGTIAVIVAALVQGALVRRAVRPLNRLADAAREVSQLELGRGEVDLPVRVDTSSLHPNNEVAEVGNSFNHMLNNVEGALAARQASESKVRQFVADASHELRNPLAAIRGYAELTRRQAPDLPPDTSHALQRIDAESLRMSKLVNDLLLLARLDNAPELASRPVDLTEVVLNAVSDARAASPDHTWTLQVPDVPTIVSGEGDRLHQAVTNLLSNARTHTPPGTTVFTAVERDGDQIVVRVVDDGPGIPPDMQRLVFERFARGDSARTHSAAESTGLGLAIVSAVVTAHGGRVWLTSRPGHTEFSIALPASAPALQA